MQHLQPNTTLQGGKYRIERVLGQGGFGITYLAVQTANNRYIAIKELFIGGSGQAINERRGNLVVVTNSANRQSFNQQKAKFKKEALRLTSLNHSNLVKVYELFEENGTVYYVMDYIDGESLRTKINREGRLSESLVLKYIKQVTPALEVAHKQSIWHLDIKPENIMVDKYDHAYLIDFGASKHIERSGTLTTSLALAYTPGYCAPELTDLLNESEEGFAEAMREIGPWTDIYSLGATMYNLLTDSIPPSSKRIERNGSNAFSFPSDVSSSTKDLIIWMMRPNRDERPQMVRDLFNRRNHANEVDERTVLEGSRSTKRTNSPHNNTHATSPVDNSYTTEGNSNSIIWWIIGIAVAAIIVFFIYNIQGAEDNSNIKDSYSNTVEGTPVTPLTTQPQETDIYKDRVEQFAKKQSGVIASFPNDKRYSVYYSQKTTYGHKEMYRYDAVTDKTEKLNLPIEATIGYTDLWLTKNNRYIFIAAEERYVDFIKIDTETGQIRYIADCQKVKRTSKGFTITKISRCINGDTAQYSYEYEYAYIDYFYNEEGEFVGSSEEYK